MVINTWFEKSNEKLISWKRPGTLDTTIISTERFATLDHIMCNKRDRRYIKNVESNIEVAFPSDHFPMYADMKVKVRRQEQQLVNLAVKYETPNDDEQKTVQRQVERVS